MENFDLLGISAGLQTGIRNLDSVIQLRSGIHSFEAATGGGKSALLLQVAHSSQYPTIFLNCDMLMADLHKRLVAISTEIPVADVLKQSRDDLQRLQSLTVSKNTHLSFENGKGGFISLDFLREKIKDKWQSNADAETVVVMIDSVDNWIDIAAVAGVYSGKSKEDILKELLTFMLDLVEHDKVTFVVSVQKPRDAGADSFIKNAVKKASDTYTVLRFERGGRPDANDLIDTAFVVEKNRSGDQNKTVFGKFSGKRQVFN